MGATKLVGEFLVKHYANISKTIFTAVRFGNVINSNGSVIPLFIKQIKNGGPVTVTDKNIERFFMTIPEAVSLILKTCTFTDTGKIYVLDMGKPVNIYNLALKLIDIISPNTDKTIEVEIIGLRPGEKLSEEVYYKSEDLLKTDDGKILALSGKNIIDTDIYNKVLSLIDLSFTKPTLVKEELFNLINNFLVV